MHRMIYVLKKQRVARGRSLGMPSFVGVLLGKMKGGYPTCKLPRILALALVLFLLVGCVGALKRGPSDEELVTQVMQQWTEGWATLNADLLDPLMSETYYGANGEKKEDLLSYVRRWKATPENRATFILDDMTVEVLGDRATVRGIRADVDVKDSDIIGQFKLDYSLQKEEGVWRITGAALAS